MATDERIYGDTPPLADATEENELRKLDVEISKLREKMADMDAARGGSREALAKVLEKPKAEMEAATGGATLFEHQQKVREMQRSINEQLRFAERQRGEIQQRAQSRVMARAETMLRKLPPADQQQINELQTNPERLTEATARLGALGGELLELVKQGDARSAIDKAVELRTQAALVDSATPAGAGAKAKGLPGPNEVQVQQQLAMVMPQVMQIVSPDTQPGPSGGGLTVMAPTMGVGKSSTDYDPSRPSAQGPTGISFDTPGGQRASELNIGVRHDLLNGGRPTNIPLLVPGQIGIDALLSGEPATRQQVETAVRWAASSGYRFPSFATDEEAEQFASARHAGLERMETPPGTPVRPVGGPMPPGMLPEGLRRESVTTKFGTSNQLVPAAGQQLAFVGGPEGIQGGLVPQGASPTMPHQPGETPVVAPTFAALPGMRFGFAGDNPQAPTAAIAGPPAPVVVPAPEPPPVAAAEPATFGGAAGRMVSVLGNLTNPRAIEEWWNAPSASAATSTDATALASPTPTAIATPTPAGPAGKVRVRNRQTGQLGWVSPQFAANPIYERAM